MYVYLQIVLIVCLFIFLGGEGVSSDIYFHAIERFQFANFDTEKAFSLNLSQAYHSGEGLQCFFGDFGLDLWCRTICSWTIEEFSKSNMLQDHI